MEFMQLTELTELAVQNMDADDLAETIDILAFNLKHQPNLDIETIWAAEKVKGWATRYIQTIMMEKSIQTTADELEGIWGAAK